MYVSHADNTHIYSTCVKYIDRAAGTQTEADPAQCHMAFYY